MPDRLWLRVPLEDIEQAERDAKAAYDTAFAEIRAALSGSS